MQIDADAAHRPPLAFSLPSVPAAVILAAGNSSRLGSPKQLVRLNGESLLDRAIRVATEAGCRPVVVILGASEDRIRRECALDNALVLTNPAWQNGMGTSLARGIAALLDPALADLADPPRTALNNPKGPPIGAPEGGVLVLTCDMPAVTPEHLRALAQGGDLVASAYAGRKGVPAFFPAALVPALLTLSGDTGARDLLRGAPALELPHGDLDIDTPADLLRAQTLFP